MLELALALTRGPVTTLLSAVVPGVLVGALLEVGLELLDFLFLDGAARYSRNLFLVGILS